MQSLSIKRGVLPVLIIAILIIPLCVSMAFNPAGVTEVRVDLTFNESDKGWGETRFDSIQTAVDTVDPVTKINVETGIYEESIIIEEKDGIYLAGTAS